MIKGYSEVPENWGIIAPYVNRGSLVQGIFCQRNVFSMIPVLFVIMQILRNRMQKKYWNIYDSRMES